MDFKDITSEQYREYDFGNGNVVRIEQPQQIDTTTSSSGGHRIVDADGVSHYIPAGWFHLSWKVKDGREPFDF